LFWPRKPWPWGINLFGDLEGHCEHLQIVLPPGVELVGGSWLDKSKELKLDVVNQVLPEKVDEKKYRQVSAETHAKLFRRVVAIRRHASIPREKVRVQFGLLPTLEGVFGPLMIAQVLLLIGLVFTMGTRYLSGSILSGSGDFGSINVTLLLGLISTVITVVVERTDQPLRQMMLRTLYAWATISSVVGALALSVFVLAPGVQWLPGIKCSSLLDPVPLHVTKLCQDVGTATWYFAGVALVIVLWATYFLVCTWIRLFRARRQLRGRWRWENGRFAHTKGKLGRTLRLPIASLPTIKHPSKLVAWVVVLILCTVFIGFAFVFGRFSLS